jgi:cell division protein FtsW
MAATVHGHPAVRAARARREAARASNTSYVALFAVLAVLVLIGLVMVVSASSVVALRQTGSSWHYFGRQLVGVGGGLVLFLVTVRIDYRVWRRLALPFYGLTTAGLVMVLLPGFGVHANGSARWIDLGIIQLQPSEFAKLSTLLVVADVLTRRQAWIFDPKRTVRPVILWFGLVALLLMMQPNLGTTMVLGVAVLAVLFTAGAPTASLAAWSGIGVLGAVYGMLGTAYRRERFFAFLDPWQVSGSAGYQNIQAQVSLGSGGWLGVGLGESRSKWGFLPEAHTDFIFAILGEELGLLGAFTVVALFAGLAYLGIRASAQAPDVFGRLLAIGITTWLCVQAFVNIGVVVGILPITGVPLPFISFGSSAMLANMAAAGMLCNVARRARR